jgi:hypothetical protein
MEATVISNKTQRRLAQRKQLHVHFRADDEIVACGINV